MSGTLEEKGLVHRNKGRPHTFSLTPEGRDLALRVVQVTKNTHTDTVCRHRRYVVPTLSCHIPQNSPCVRGTC